MGTRFGVRDRTPAIKMALVDARAIETAPIAAREPATARQPRVDRLAPSDRAAVESFYAAAYPGNWFDPSMLETGCYFGIRDPGTIRDTPSSGSSHTPSSGGSHTPSSGSSHAPPSGGSDSEDDDSPAPVAPLVCVAGVHVFSPTYRVAALGNIATHPSFRRRGYGARVTAELCRHLATRVETIGLNVHADNAAAIACYRKLGFKEIARFEEVTLARRD
ncbi:MAG: N-acetyltransferase [Candidatus Eisenbacteria bacterium]